MNVIKQFNHLETALCTQIERDFLRTLEGGCTAPIGALAIVEGNNIQFQGGVFSLDGKRKFIIDKTFEKSADQKGIKLANQLLKAGASDLLQEFKSSS